LYIDALNVLRVGKDRGEEEEVETAKKKFKKRVFSGGAAVYDGRPPRLATVGITPTTPTSAGK